MAVYTHVDETALSAFLRGYDVGTATGFKGIAEGIENTNYLLETDKGRYILTLYEKRVNVDDLPFFLALMEHFADAGLPAARPIADRQGNLLHSLCGRTAALIGFVPGLSIDDPSPAQCRTMGAMLARCHRAAGDFTLNRKNDLSLSGWHTLAGECGGDVDRCDDGLARRIKDELAFLDAHWPSLGQSALPSGVIHADYFPDNVMFGPDEEISGLIDFYFSCTDFYIYDLAICINAWCFDEAHEFSPTRSAQFLEGYTSVRPLSAPEWENLPLMLRGSAMRFLLTRCYDWLNQVPGALVRVKDPLEYDRKLRFHQQQGDQPEWLGTIKQRQDRVIKVYTDGACSGNPGPGGWGVYVMTGDEETELKGGEPATTNNRMELMAAIEALRHMSEGTPFALYTDSTYVKNGLNEWIKNWKKNNWRTASRKPVKNRDLWEELDALAAKHTIEWHWVKGHAGDPGNERADLLARQGLDAYGRD